MKSILEQVVSCITCSWIGTVDDCEPELNGEGDLGCPRCAPEMNLAPYLELIKAADALGCDVVRRGE